MSLNLSISYVTSESKSCIKFVCFPSVYETLQLNLLICLFVCVEVLRPIQPYGVMSSVVTLPNHTFTGQA